MSSYAIDPSEFGLARVRPKELVGGNAGRERGHYTGTFSVGEKGRSATSSASMRPLRSWRGARRRPCKDGFELAQRTIDSGAAMENWNS